MCLEANSYTREAGADATTRILDTVGEINAIVAANDLLALGALDSLKKRGLRCPEDISIVGHNDMPFMDVVSPPLTTVRIEHREMGRRAGRMLIDAIKTGSSNIGHVVLCPELIVRNSTQALRG